jgi:hypothetical protein
MEAQASTEFRSAACDMRMTSWLQAIYDFFYEMFFGCSHGHLTRPFTLQAHSYKVCLDCGRQFPYSLDKMRLLYPWEIVNQPTVELMPIALESGRSEQQNYNRTKAVA